MKVRITNRRDGSETVVSRETAVARMKREFGTGPGGPMAHGLSMVDLDRGEEVKTLASRYEQVEDDYPGAA